MTILKPELKSWRHWLTIWLATIISYCLLGSISLGLGTIGGTASPFWLPAGVIVALSFIYGYRVLPGVFLGQFLFATFFEPGTPWNSLMLSMGNVMEGAAICYLTPRFLQGNNPFSSIRNFLYFYAAVAAGCVFNVLIGCTALLFSGLIPFTSYGDAMLSWGIGDLGGTLIVAPLIYAWWKPDVAAWSFASLPERISFLFIACGITYLVFGGLLTLYSAPMAFFLLPLLLWSALRLELATCTVLNALMMGIAIWGTTHGHGPFATASPTESLVLIQAFTSVIIVTSLMTFIVSQDRRRVTKKLRQHASVLEATVAQRTEQLTQELTERKHAELVAKKSHQQVHSLLNSMAEGAFGVDIYGNCTFVNGSFLHILGYTNADELIGRHIHEIIHHSHADGSYYPSTECRMYAAYRHEKTHVSDEVFWRKDGIAVPVEYWSQPIVTDGIWTGAIATFIDITERKKTENALKKSEQRLRSIIETSPECIKIVDNRGRIIEMNAAGLAMLQADSLEELQQRTIFDYVEADGRDAFLSLFYKVMEGESGVLEFRIKGLKGRMRYLETHAMPMRDSNGVINSLLGITRDVTESKEAEQQLRIAATAFESHAGMLVTDAYGDILRVNHAFTSITGYPANEVIGQNPSLFSSGIHDGFFYTAMWDNIRKTGAWEGEIWNRHKSGEVYPAHLTITAVKNTIGLLTNYVASLTDITLSKAASEKIKRLAFYDPLTSLPNRRLLVDRLHHALASCTRSGRQGALLFLDLDHFKTINDTLGHDTGDLLLQLVAERLTHCVRENDTVARLGGDEFVVMLEELSEQPIESAAQAEVIGNKILASLNQPYELGTRPYYNTSSIGITLFSDHEHEIEELLKQADIAMYQAKNAGRNTLRFFDPQMQENINSRVALEHELRQALEKQQFQLYYQIQVNTAGRTLGAEALIRWIHPERGLISPAQFIPLAEETGLILSIGQWVLDAACAQLRIWQQDERMSNLSLSVNVSARQFRQPDFIAQIQASLQRNGANPSRLKLELTESMLLESVDETIAIMTELNEIGVQFSLDDFGTGYSSLQYLKRLPLDQIKIDQSFVHDITFDAQNRSIVRTIIAMAHSLELDVIAEGVETEEQKRRLLNKGCTHFQGYLFGRPLPVEELDRLLC